VSARSSQGLASAPRRTAWHRKEPQERRHNPKDGRWPQPEHRKESQGRRPRQPLWRKRCRGRNMSRCSAKSASRVGSNMHSQIFNEVPSKSHGSRLRWLTALNLTIVEWDTGGSWSHGHDHNWPQQFWLGPLAVGGREHQWDLRSSSPSDAKVTLSPLVPLSPQQQVRQFRVKCMFETTRSLRCGQIEVSQ
jgi:hypothetical protein